MKTFLNIEQDSSRADSALFHVLPVPYEGADPFCARMALAPDAILDASANMGDVDPGTRQSLTKFGVYTHEPLPCAPTARDEMAALENATLELDLFRPRRMPIFLGGSPAISGALIRAASKIYRNLSVVQFSAHAALLDSFGVDGPDSHACAMARALECVKDLVHVGTRDLREQELARFPKQAELIVPPEALDDSFGSVVEKVLWKTGAAVYVTLNMDVFDPSFAPGVAAPEPGGLTWRQFVKLLAEIVAGKSVVGFDVVGMAPLGGNNVVTEFAAARAAAKLIAAVSKKRGG